ncbi:MAG: formate acetyltransferase, partial [Bacteroidales bacterium]|nr:formate acetyltransferase [Bacteroidales bacterium]
MKFNNESWNGFKGDVWRDEINVRDFIQSNYTPYDGDESFLVASSEKTRKVWNKLTEMFKVERERGVYDAETKLPQTITTYGPGYIDKENEVVVGLQTDAPLKRSLQPFGGIRMAETSCKSYGYEVDPEVSEIFTKYRKTHNQGVFDVYTPEMKAARHSAIITGLPDAYGRGRIIGDYRRVALYGIDRLIEDKKAQFKSLEGEMTPDRIQLREEITEQIRALKEMVELGKIYGFDISKPASTAKEAIQWLYFGYLSAVKEQNGAAMSIGRTSTFLDIY